MVLVSSVVSSACAVWRSLALRELLPADRDSRARRPPGGGLGNDTFIFDPADTTQVAGGTGVDTLKFTGSGKALDLAGKAGTVYTGLEAIDFTSTGNALSFSAADVVKLSTTTNDLFVNGIVGDSITSTGQGWVAGADETISGIFYHSYTSGAAHLHVQADMTAMLS